MSSIEKSLALMHKMKKTSPEKKGSQGELVALEVLKEYMRVMGGTTYHSYKYPYQTSKKTGKVFTGNIRFDEEKNRFYSIEKSSHFDEIDLLYVSERSIIPIECKAYNQKIRFYDCWWETNSNHKDKSPITQEEKHCRHLYHLIADLLPEGISRFIKPLVVFIDIVSVDDTRSTEQQKYIQICQLNKFKKALSILDVNKEEYRLDYKLIEKELKNRSSGCQGVYR